MMYQETYNLMERVVLTYYDDVNPMKGMHIREVLDIATEQGSFEQKCTYILLEYQHIMENNKSGLLETIRSVKEEVETLYERTEGGNLNDYR